MSGSTTWHRDGREALSVRYMDLSARFALDHGLHVVIEGILHSEIYDEMLARLQSDHRGANRSYYCELALAETLRRLRAKPLAEKVSVDTVASWYRDADLVRGLDGVVFDETASARESLERVLADIGWGAPMRLSQCAPHLLVSELGVKQGRSITTGSAYLGRSRAGLHFLERCPWRRAPRHARRIPSRWRSSLSAAWTIPVEVTGAEAFARIASIYLVSGGGWTVRRVENVWLVVALSTVRWTLALP